MAGIIARNGVHYDSHFTQHLGAMREGTMATSLLFDDDPALYDVATTSAGPGGALPFTEQILLERPGGFLFGWTQDAAMGWNPAELGRGSARNSRSMTASIPTM